MYNQFTYHSKDASASVSYMQLPLFIFDETHQGLVHFSNSFGKIFGFVNHCYFLQPSFMDFYPFHYFNPSDFTGSENVVRMSSILTTQGPSGLECDPLLQKFHVCPQNRHFVFSGYKLISHVIQIFYTPAYFWSNLFPRRVHLNLYLQR